jgi:two-component system, chemotaxis family, sensor kinase CheA
LSEREIIDIIFQPGFSTAENVTNFSGRGVGMDVVRINIERIGGAIDVETRVGRGTTLRMKIPLTLAIIPAVTITSGGDRYAIPQISLLEMVRLEGEQARKGIENMHGAPVYRLRGKLLPIVYLAEQFGIEPSQPLIVEEINIVVLQAEDRSFGLVVDAIHDTEEIVVKPLQKLLKGIGCYAGATIMGDGKVALILDVLAIAQRANVVSGVRTRAVATVTAEPQEADGDRQTLLLFNASDGGRMAIPLAQVARLEEFPRSAIERVGSQDVVQYRKDVMPLLDVARMLRRRRGKLPSPRGEHETLQVIVYAGKKQRIGLVVGEILDAVEETIGNRSPAQRAGVLFTAIIQGRTTEFLDIEWLIRAADPDFFEQSDAAIVEAGV